MRRLRKIVLLVSVFVTIHNSARAQDQVVTGRDPDFCPTALDLRSLKQNPDFNATFYQEKGLLSRLWERFLMAFGEPVTNHKLTSGLWLTAALNDGTYGKISNYKYVWLVNEGALVNTENSKVGDILYLGDSPNSRCFYTNEGARVMSGSYSIAFFFRGQ